MSIAFCVLLIYQDLCACVCVTLELGAHSHCPLQSVLSHSPGAFALAQRDHCMLPLKEQ